MVIISKTFELLEDRRKKRTNGDVALIFLVSAITMLFIPLVILLFRTNETRHVSLSASFSLSSLVIVFGSRLIYKAKQYLTADALKRYRLSLLGVLASGILFIFLQYLGWKDLLIALGNREGNLIQVMMIVHAFHFSIAIVLLTVLLIQTSGLHTGSDLYIYFLNFKKYLFVKNVFRYWEYLTFLWIFLYTLMLIHYLS